jgi:hypothetical protein
MLPTQVDFDLIVHHFFPNAELHKRSDGTYTMLLGILTVEFSFCLTPNQYADSNDFWFSIRGLDPCIQEKTEIDSLEDVEFSIRKLQKIVLGIAAGILIATGDPQYQEKTE